MRGRATVLMVEDCEEAIAALEIAVEAAFGCEVRLCVDGDEARQYLAGCSEAPMAMITDLQLPRRDGFELIDYVRRERGWGKLPVIVVSADVAAGTAERLRRMGADAQFGKPCSPAVVCQALKRILHEKQHLSPAGDGVDAGAARAEPT